MPCDCEVYIYKARSSMTMKRHARACPFGKEKVNVPNRNPEPEDTRDLWSNLWRD